MWKLESRSVTRASGLSGSLKVEVLLARVACPEAVARTSGIESRSYYSHEWLVRKIENRSVTHTSGLSGSLKVEVLFARVACPGYSHEWLVHKLLLARAALKVEAVTRASGNSGILKV